MLSVALIPTVALILSLSKDEAQKLRRRMGV